MGQFTDGVETIARTLWGPAMRAASLLHGLIEVVTLYLWFGFVWGHGAPPDQALANWGSDFIQAGKRHGAPWMLAMSMGACGLCSFRNSGSISRASSASS